MSVTTTQAQIFATEYAKDAAREMLDTIKGSAKKAGRVTGIALAISMPHQIGFILGMVPLHWSGLSKESLESLTLVSGSVGIPVAVDYLILICIQILAARGMVAKTKSAAFWVMLFPIAVSGTVNFLAPAPLLVRILFVVAVVLIPLAEGLRAMIRPDFAKIERMETEVFDQIEAPTVKVTAKVTEAEKSARRRAGYSRMTKGQKASWTTAYRARVSKRTPVEEIEALEDVAPVSPAFA